MIYEIKVPHLGFNDQRVTIVQWHKNDKDKVEAKESICTIETSKAAFVLEAGQEGYLRITAAAGSEVGLLGTIGYIVSNLDERLPKESPLKRKTAAKKEKTVFTPNKELSDRVKINATKKALKLADEYGINLWLINKNGIIKERDVLDFIESGKKGLRQKKEKLIIIGNRGHAKMCIDLIRQLGTFEIVGILCRAPESGEKILGIPVIGGDSDESLGKVFKEGVRFAVVGFGGLDDREIREKVFNRLKKIGFSIPNLIHPSAIIEPSVGLGEGNQIMAGAIIGSNAVISNNCVVSSGAIISHDCVLHNNCFVSPGAILAGTVVVGENTLIGMGVSVFFGLKIGKNVTIVNGKNVFHDISDNTFLK